MEMLKDLPSYNKANFSKFTQGGSKVGVVLDVIVETKWYSQQLAMFLWRVI